jgi:hypothetical protein
MSYILIHVDVNCITGLDYSDLFSPFLT